MLVLAVSFINCWAVDNFDNEICDCMLPVSSYHKMLDLHICGFAGNFTT